MILPLTPLAIPMLAGPIHLFTNRFFYHEHHSIPEIIFSILAIPVAALLLPFYVLKSAHYLAKILERQALLPFQES
jgi:small neutral amino acid transporter SnatA (MarC family)